MAANVFKVGSTTMKDPISWQWEDSQIDTSLNRKPVLGIYWKCTLSFNMMTIAQYSSWDSFDDGASHSVQLPSPHSYADTTYTGAFIRVKGAGGAGANQFVYNATVEISGLVGA